MPIASRISDKTVHGGAVLTGSPDVLIGGMPAARIDDGHVCPIHPGGPIAQGSATVLINGRPASRFGDKLMCTPGAPPSQSGKAGVKYEPDKIGEREKLYGDDAKKADGEKADGDKADGDKADGEQADGEQADGEKADGEKKPPKPEFSVEATLVERKAEGEVQKFAGEHGKLLAGQASADVRASAQINGIRDMKGELAASAGASGSVVSLEGKTEGSYGTAKASGEFLTAEAKAKAGASIDTSKGEGALGVEGGVGAAVFKGKIEGETKGWRIPFTDWEIGASGGVEGTLLGVEAKGHAGISYNRKDGFRMGAGGKISAFLAGIGINFSIFVRPIKKEQKVAPDVLVTGCPTVTIGDDGLMEKKQRMADRQALIDKARAQAGDPATPKERRDKLKAAADRLERNNAAVERARLSQHVYATDKEPVPAPPVGWSQLGPDELAELGVQPEHLINKENGFKAAVYRSELEQPPKLVVAFAGTDDKPDVVTDVRQGLGFRDPQYDQAMDLTRTVATKAQGSGYAVETTGHSLGGGLASAGSAVSGVRGTTFNAAGLHNNTTRNLSPADRAANQRNVNAYHNTSDPLNNAQDMIGVMPDAYGNRIPIAPAAEHEHSWLDLFSRNPIDAVKDMALDGHGIGTMVDAIEAEKMQDIATMGGTP